MNYSSLCCQQCVYSCFNYFLGPNIHINFTMITTIHWHEFWSLHWNWLKGWVSVCSPHLLSYAFSSSILGNEFPFYLLIQHHPCGVSMRSEYTVSKSCDVCCDAPNCLLPSSTHLPCIFALAVERHLPSTKSFTPMNPNAKHWLKWNLILLIPTKNNIKSTFWSPSYS